MPAWHIDSGILHFLLQHWLVQRPVFSCCSYWQVQLNQWHTCNASTLIVFCLSAVAIRIAYSIIAYDPCIFATGNCHTCVTAQITVFVHMLQTSVATTLGFAIVCRSKLLHMFHSFSTFMEFHDVDSDECKHLWCNCTTQNVQSTATCAYHATEDSWPLELHSLLVTVARCADAGHTLIAALCEQPTA